MDEQTRFAFGLNLYNLMITYAFIKYGIGRTSFARSAFFSKVCFNIGGDFLSFNDLENGILRANARHTYSFSPPFPKDDPRLRLSLAKVDCRLGPPSRRVSLKEERTRFHPKAHFDAPPLEGLDSFVGLVG
jgi:hypothetical protein